MEFQYTTVGLKDLQIELKPIAPVRVKDTEKGVDGYAVHGGMAVDAIIIDGERITPTGRFWESLYSRFNLNKAFFKFFTHKEVFERINEREKDTKIRLCIERKTNGNPRLLAATGLNRPVLVYDDLLDILERYGAKGDNVRYDSGVIRSTHTPRTGDYKFQIGGDEFRNRFELHAPIDGYGQPAMYLSMLRLICANGAIGYANAFRTALQLGHGGDNTRYALIRALDGFNNEDGYAALRDRFETATKSWASLHEQQSLYHTLIRLDETSKNKDITPRFEQITGRPMELYHRDPNLLTEKKQRTLPVACRVYDIINFATEVSTHNVSEKSARVLDAWVGELISHDFDLEDSCDHFDDWRAFFLRDNRDKFAEASRARESVEDDSKQ